MKNHNQETKCRKHVRFAFFFLCVCEVFSDFIFHFRSEGQIWSSSKPSPLIGGELVLVESPQEGAETCHFLLELGARDWLAEVEAWRFIWQDERRMVQEALKDVYEN